MPRRKETNEDVPQPRRRPGTTPEARENQLVNLAFDVAEQQMRAGTASAMVVSHFLKLGSKREELERIRLEAEIKLSEAKVEGLAASGRIETMYKEALEAMRTYSGQRPAVSDSDYED